MRIALDVMGGDHGCEIALAGAKLALAADPKISSLLLVGQQELIHPALKRTGLSDARVQILHASEVLTMEDKPLDAIRRKKDSSMVRAIDMIREDKADAVVSPGNTGALVAGSMKLRRIEGVERLVATRRQSSQAAASMPGKSWVCQNPAWACSATAPKKVKAMSSPVKRRGCARSST